MYILVLDLEMNQPSEKIIELGYVIGNLETKEILIRKSVFVNPEETLSPDIIKLTGISQSIVDGASTLQDAYDTMVADVKSIGALTMIHQWGVSDSFLLRKQLGENANWIFGRRWIDTKALSQTHALVHKKKLRGGLKRMAGQIGIQVSSELAHRADYDAEITFLVHCNLADHFLLK